MSVVQSVSDLTRSLTLQRQGRDMRAALDAAGKALTTGLHPDLRAATDGNLGPILAIDRDLERIDVQQSGLALARTRAAASQEKLGLLAGIADETGLNMLAAIGRGDPISVERYAAEAWADLDMIRAAVNADFGGRQLFSGAAMDTPPLADTAVVVGDVRALIESAPDSATAIAAIDAYFFDAGGGFESNVYLGSTTDAPAVELAAGARLDFLPRADATPVRYLMRGLAIAAAISDGASTASDEMRNDLLAEAGGGISGSKSNLVGMAAGLGIAQQQIEDAQSFASGERDRLQLARGDLAGVDSYTAATDFAALEQQLQALYTVTVRMSSLNLTNYL